MTAPGVEAAARACLEAGDWEGARLLLHPYLHWRLPDGSTLRGRSRVLAALQGRGNRIVPEGTPELRDDQVYRWAG